MDSITVATDVLKKTFNLRVVGYYFLFLLAEVFVTGLVTVILALPFGVYAIGSLGSVILTSPLTLFDPAVWSGLALFGGITFVVLVLVWLLLSALFDGMRFSFSKALLEGKPNGFGLAFSEAKSRILPVFGARLIWAIPMFLIALLVFLPVLLGIMPLLSQAGTSLGPELAGSILGFIVLLFVGFLIFGLGDDGNVDPPFLPLSLPPQIPSNQCRCKPSGFSLIIGFQAG